MGVAIGDEAFCVGFSGPARGARRSHAGHALNGVTAADNRAIDDLLAQGRQERDPRKRAAIYNEAQKRLMRDAVVLPLSEVPNEWARNPKRVSTPFDPDYGEDALHFSYNYPELLKLLN